jgi:hypothetical protein
MIVVKDGPDAGIAEHAAESTSGPLTTAVQPSERTPSRVA